MATTNEIQAMRDAAELIDAIADVIESGDLDRLPASADMTAFAHDLKLLADAADERTYRGEFFGT